MQTIINCMNMVNKISSVKNVIVLEFRFKFLDASQ